MQKAINRLHRQILASVRMALSIADNTENQN